MHWIVTTICKNILKIQNEYSEIINRQCNGQKENKTKRQAIIHKTLHRKQNILNIEQHESTKTREWTEPHRKGRRFLLHYIYKVILVILLLNDTNYDMEIGLQVNECKTWHETCTNTINKTYYFLWSKNLEIWLVSYPGVNSIPPQLNHLHPG